VNGRRVARAAGLYAATSLAGLIALVLTYGVLHSILGDPLAFMVGGAVACLVGTVSGLLWMP
jgi:hypothetical protein